MNVEENVWSVENADDDLDRFIKEASDEIFKKRFSAWFGRRENFDYLTYKNTITERIHQSKKNGKSDCFSARESRRVYKMTLAKIRDMENAVDLDCFRCMLIIKGSHFLGSFKLHSCKIQFYPGEITEEELWHQRPGGSPSCEDYPAIMAISIASSSVFRAPPIDKDQSFIGLIKNRKMMEERVFEELDENLHNCDSTPNQLGKFQVVPINACKNCTSTFGVYFYGDEIENCLIYAPPGFGKTTVQQYLIEKGIVILDTDDIACVTTDKVRQMLNRSSVFTNRLDLLNIDVPLIMFEPANAQLLLERNAKFPFTEDDARYWFEGHKKIETRPKMLRCTIKSTYLLDWFLCKSANTNLGGLTEELNPLMKKFDYVSNLKEPLKEDDLINLNEA